MGSPESHCLYICLKQYISEVYSIGLNESIIYYLLGGHHFNYYKLDNSITPSLVIKGNVIDFNYARNFGLNIKTINESNSKEALLNMNNELSEKGKQIIFANCFYLPFDKGNFKKNHDKHTLIINKFNNMEKKVNISTLNYSNVEINIEDLINSRSKNKEGYTYLQISINIEKVSSNRIKKKIIELLKIKNYEVDCNNMKLFADDFIKLFGLEEPFKGISLLHLVQQIKHPHGPIICRKLSSQFFEEIGYSNLALELENLSNEWFEFSNLILKARINNSYINPTILKMQKILEGEMKFFKHLV